MDSGIGLGVGGVFAVESGGSGSQDEGTSLYLFGVSGGRPGTGISLANTGDSITSALWHAYAPPHPLPAAMPMIR
ncbi:MAG TPA: hypothetical protein VKG80_04140 [Trebonia sp.]|nr:hypothetical protein [Trebonia sp.]